jgi:hypothetical protein
MPAFWRRVADQSSWQEAEAMFGPLDGVSVPASDGYLSEDWQRLHSRLVMIAKLWRPVADHPTLYLPADWKTLRQNEAARSIPWAIRGLIDQGQLVADIDIGTWLPGLRANSLRAFLWADCATAVGTDTPYRRCHHCTEWFVPARSDAVYCSMNCKQAAYAARKAGGD